LAGGYGFSVAARLSAGGCSTRTTIRVAGGVFCCRFRVLWFGKRWARMVVVQQLLVVRCWSTRMLRVAVGATWETAFRRRFLLDSRYTWGFGVPAAAGRWLEPATGLVRRLFDLSARDERNPLWWWWRGLRSGHQCCGPSSFARPFRERPCPAPGTVSCLAASLALSVGADGHPWPDFRQVRVGLSAIHSADGAVRGLPLAVG